MSKARLTLTVTDRFSCPSPPFLTHTLGDYPAKNCRGVSSARITRPVRHVGRRNTVPVYEPRTVYRYSRGRSAGARRLTNILRNFRFRNGRRNTTKYTRPPTAGLLSVGRVVQLSSGDNYLLADRYDGENVIVPFCRRGIVKYARADSTVELTLSIMAANSYRHPQLLLF